jgi:extradiol dioxygenase family protein
MNPFHLAIPVSDLKKCRSFYTEILGCEKGREDSHWIDLNFYGHQLVLHEKPGSGTPQNDNTNPVDGEQVPVPHFGVVLGWEDWEALAVRLKRLNVRFVIEPTVRFKGRVGEQATMFFLDPSGNALEFKAFKDQSQLFAK